MLEQQMNEAMERFCSGTMTYGEYKEAVEALNKWAEDFAAAMRKITDALTEAMKPVIEAIRKAYPYLVAHKLHKQGKYDLLEWWISRMESDRLCSPERWPPLYSMRYDDDLRDVALN